MSNIKRFFLGLLAGCPLALACGGDATSGNDEDAAPVVSINELGQVVVDGELLAADSLGGPVDSDAGSDLGSTSEALVVPDGYGYQESTVRACQATHNALNDACHIVWDKIVKPRWVGPCTSSELPDFDLCRAFNDGVTLIRPHLQGGGFSVPFPATSGDETLRNADLGTGTLGYTDDRTWGTTPASTTASSVDNQKGVDGKFYYKKGNACDIGIDLDQIGSLPAEFRYPIFVRVVEHEIGHCAGLPHVKPDNCTDLMNASACVSIPTSLSSAEHTALFNFQP